MENWQLHFYLNRFKMDHTTLKIYGINMSSLAISFTEIDMVLKLLLLIVTIGYTINKWYLMNKNKNKE